MTISNGAHRSWLLRRRRLLLAVLLSIVCAGVGAGVWFAHTSSAGPIPPRIPSDLNEPEVSALLERMRARVLKEPRSASAWGILGQAFLANDMEDESRVCFTEAEHLDPNNPRWPHYQAVLLLTQGEQQAALPYLQRAAERAAMATPDNPVPQLLLAETLLTLERIAEAEDHFRQVLVHRPDEVRAHWGLALTDAARQDWRSSRAHLLPCLSSPVVRRKASLKLATICKLLGKPEKAENYRRQAERLPPDDKWNDPFVAECLPWTVTKNGLYRQASSLEAAGRLREAANVLQPLVAKFPDDYFPRLSLGKILGQLGEHRPATVLLYDACRLAPDNVQAHYYLSLTLFSEAENLRQQESDSKEAQKLYREAVESARQALALKPDYGFALMTLGLSLKRLGQRGDALTALRQAVHCNPEFADAHFFLGDMLADMGTQGEAEEQLERAIAIAPPQTSWRQDAVARLAALRSTGRSKNK